MSRPPASIPDVEGFFSSLEVHEHFALLEWHLELVEKLHRMCATRASINLHNSVVHTEADRSRLLSLLSQSTVPLTLEFTETYPMPSPGIANPLLRELRRMGHSTALDDFGSGHNGRSLLTDYDFDAVKIDRKLILDAAARPERRRMLGLMFRMLQVLGRNHVVEGIEEQEDYLLLREMGYRIFQGYLFQRPIPMSEYFTAAHTSPPVQNRSTDHE